MPSINPSERMEQLCPTQGDFGLIEWTDAQLWDAVDIIVTELLNECAWTQLLDAPITNEERMLWQDYRQTLRSIRDRYSDPRQIVYPTRPA